jgi:hypothetical protein
MDKLAFKKDILKSGIEKQLELISDFRSSIDELKSTSKNINETQFDSQQASYNDETNERVDLMTGQLNFAVDELHILHQIDPEEIHDTIHVGSVVHTDKRIFFVSVSLEELVVNGTDVFGISTKAPIYAKMQGLKSGDSFKVNNFEYQIEEVY